MNRRREVKLNNRDINVYNNNNGENATAASKVVAPPAAIKRPAENSLKNISNIPSEFKKEKVDHGCAKKEATHNESQEIVSTLSEVVLNSAKKQENNPKTSDLTKRSAPVVYVDENLKENAGCSIIEEANVEAPTIERVIIFDQESVTDMNAVTTYVQDIFNYYKSREQDFKIGDYLKKHQEVTVHHRAKLVDVLVDLQEQFELNHETLYLGAKLFDMFMDKVKTVRPDKLRIVGSVALFLASKFDERAPPLADDFVYMAEVANEYFDRDDLVGMEDLMLNTIEFVIGAPISYRFLRRYSRVAKIEMPTLTLARYILETSLMYLSFCRVSESVIAAACLSLAMRMKKMVEWSSQLELASGYTLEHIDSLVWALNHMIICTKKEFPSLQTIQTKYSHEVFFQVAKIPHLEDKLKDMPVGPPALYLPSEGEQGETINES